MAQKVFTTTKTPPPATAARRGPAVAVAPPLKGEGANWIPASAGMTTLEKLARMLRALIFASVEAGQSGHPGGSSSKVEQFLTMLLGGFVAFDPANPKNPGRDRVVWSSGHCTPLLYGGLAMLYEAMRREGRQFSKAAVGAVFPEDLASFRQTHGLPGHAESVYPLVDVSTASSGHGLSAAVGIAMAHKSSGLDTKIWVLMGDAETEEGISYEARNVAAASGLNNVIVSLDYNGFGIDGPITEAMVSSPGAQWSALGWNVLIADGHDFSALAAAYAKAQRADKPTVVVCRTIKGKHYGARENSHSSHGTPLPHDEYAAAVKKLGFDIKGEKGKAIADIEKIIDQLGEREADFISKALKKCAAKIKPEEELVKKMKTALPGRPFKGVLNVQRPKKLSPELVFAPGANVSGRKAAQAWCKWLMTQSAFVFAGAGDVSKSVLTAAAENVYGVIGPANPLGRGIRFGIAEANMGMVASALSQEILPGGIRPSCIFGTYSVFAPMMANSIRMSLIDRKINKDRRGFFVALASHDGPETGEDGPTHQGLYWMSLFDAYPGIKVYKPADANETIEMLFHALQIGEPIVLSLPRADWPVIDRACAPAASEANNGAYVFKDYTPSSPPHQSIWCGGEPPPSKGGGKTAAPQIRGGKRIVLAVCGGQLLQNTLAILPDLEKKKLNVKIIVVTAPELFEDLRARDPKKARAILSDEERADIITLHNGWPGFLRRFLLPENYAAREIGVADFLVSCKPADAYDIAELSPKDLIKKILKNVKDN
ncbi:hypothetical protein EPN28_04695 [Patescibacteria group bacterium]|nr:MAG: hypothetical protein EPN28_04695 [Patescibacteria group bacterium]